MAPCRAMKAVGSPAVVACRERGVIDFEVRFPPVTYQDATSFRETAISPHIAPNGIENIGRDQDYARCVVSRGTPDNHHRGKERPI